MKQVSNDKNYQFSICVQEFEMVWNRTENQAMWQQAMNQIGIESEFYRSNSLTCAYLFLK